jgi:hypothetical protein
MYWWQLRKILEHFPKAQLKVVIFEEMKEQPMAVLSNIFRFLAVPEDFIPNFNIRNVTKGGIRYKWLASPLHDRSSSEDINRLIRTLTPFMFRTALRRQLTKLNRVSAPKPVFSDQVREQLYQCYLPEINELEIFLNKELKIWKFY